ncbi:Hypothetical protein NocV09_05400180 [Nannochloropsis oceanica]
MKIFVTVALLSSSLALCQAVFEPSMEDVNEKVFGNARSLLDEDLPLPKDWVASTKENVPSKTFGGIGDHFGSYPYHPWHPFKPNPDGSGHGAKDDEGHTGGKDLSHGGVDKANPAPSGDHPDKMAAVPGAVAYTPKTPVVRSLETIMLKKSQEDKNTIFNLRGR